MMKTLFSNAFLGLVCLLFGGMVSSCSKTTPRIPHSPVRGQIQSGIYRMTFADGHTSLESVDIEDLKSSSLAREDRGRRSNPNAHANGKFSLMEHIPEYLSVQFNAMENNGGIHGDTEWSGSLMGNAHIETECIVTEGNCVIIGGVVTEAEGFWIPEGWHMYYMVIDNGEGGNAPPDQFWGIVLASDVDLCGQLVPASASWDPSGGTGTYNLDANGSIQVNN